MRFFERVSRRFFSLAAAAAFVAAAAAQAQAEDVAITDPENTLIIEVGLGFDSEDDAATPAETGRVVIELLPDFAPNHVERVKELTRSGFYDGIVFHRVIEGFMAQTGSPNGDGIGGSELPDLRSEFTDLRFERGVVGAARTSNPNSANSQFFIMFDRAASLDWEYTAFGRVVEGMEIVDQIKRGPRTSNGVVDSPRDRMVRVFIAADAPAE